MEKDKGSFIAGTMFGMLTGTIIGLLVAPKAGKDIRSDFSHCAMEIKSKVLKELMKVGRVTKDRYKEIIDRIVTGYEEEKKITKDESLAIKEKLVKNFEENNNTGEKQK